MKTDIPVINKLFKRLTEYYGQLWVDQFPTVGAMDAAKGKWLSALAGTSADDIRQGIDKLPDDYLETLPTAKQFAKLCGVKKPKKPVPPIPKDHVSKPIDVAGNSIRHAEMQKMRGNGWI